jgi:hypothetical protein
MAPRWNVGQGQRNLPMGKSEDNNPILVSVGTLFGFLSAVVILFAVAFGDRFPVLMLGGGIIFLCIGTMGFVIAAIESSRYKKVFDYEPAIFWGKQRNGKAIRTIIVSILMIAIWSAASAIVLLVVSLPIVFKIRIF